MNSITVFGKPYLINYVEKVDDAESLGECNVRTGEVKILSTMCDAQRGDTLIHEILHIISEELNIGMTEKQVACIAVGLYSVLKENHERIKELF